MKARDNFITGQSVMQSPGSVSFLTVGSRFSKQWLAKPLDPVQQWRKGVARHEEVVLKVGTGHGVLYKLLDEWILPAVNWAKYR